MTVGERIKQARLHRGVTQKDLAKAIGVSFQMINKYETNIVNNIPIKKVQAIADALEVDAAELAGWQREPQQDDLMALRDQLRRQPGMRILFDRTKELTDKQMDIVMNVVDGLLGREDDSV